MKFAKWLQLFAIIFAFSNLLSAQTAPSLENGWKPYGSYEGSQLDTVNLMNGNLMMHAPVIPGAPQRGSLQISTSLYVTSQDWQVVCKPGCGWSKGGTGVKIVQTPYLRVHRTVNNDYVYANTVVSDGFAYTIVGPDDSTHSLHGVAGTEDSLGEPTQFDSVDLSGYHLTMSVPDANHPTVLTHFTVTDRDGNKYEGDFGTDFATSATCPHPANFMISSPGHVQPVVDDSPVGDQYCPQTGYASSVTDRNGNQMTLAGGLGTAFVASDTLGRAPASWPITTSYGDCVSPYAITQAGLYSYQDPNGITRNIKICYSEFPIHTAFNVSGVAEAVTSTDPNSGLHFIAAASVILADGSYWAFNYDNYGEVSSIHLPTGGTLSYIWRTIAFPACTGGPRAPLSRSIQTRTLDDNRGHSSQWSYNWSAVSSTSLVNTVTDPAGNDTTHNFTDLSTQLGAGGACKFYETSTIRYKGSASANIPLERIDTIYNVAAIAVDDSSPGIGNIFATDVLTTVYPSGKVKKVHKEPDQGLGAGLPSFGNVIKQLDYDWGQGAPGALLRETDTVYRWQQADTSGNKPYLAAHLLDLPASTVIISLTSAANIKSNCPVTPTTTANCIAETDYSYDEPAYLTATNITNQHAAAPWSVRGNQTTVSHWLSTGNTWVTSHTNWYDTGEAYQQIDALGHTTTHTYDAAYAGAYATQTCSPATGSVAHCVSGTYDFNTGLLTSLTNENATTQASGNTQGDAAHTSNYSYDSMFRITSAQAPPDPANGAARAQTSFNFSALSASPFNVQRTKSITATLTDSATSYFDGLARGYQSQHVLPGGTSTVDTTFDDAHSQLIVTNPYFSTADPTYGSTTTLSDALGRATQVTKQDGSKSSVTYNVITGAHDAVIGANTVGDCTDSTDEAGKQRRACTDALGRLVQVVEPNPGSSAVTANGSVSISGSEQSATSQPGIAASIHVTIGGSDSINILTSCTPTCHTRNVADAGTIGFSVNVGGTNVSSSVSYSGTSTLPSLAAALYSAFPSNSYVTMSNPNGTASFTLTANAVSASGNSYVFTTQMATGCIDSENESCGGVGWNMTLSGPNLAPTTASTANFSGGQNASTNPDAGTVTVTLNGTAYQTTYGAGDAAGSIATRLAGLITAGNWANASASGGTITLTTKTGGTATNYSLAASYAWNNAIFVNPSFTTSTSGSVLTGGYDAGVLDNQPYVTLYQYDALGNLLRVDQKGSAPTDSTQWRTRTFTYDSLSRLLTANNPESGAITYSYDADSELLMKTSPAPNQNPVPPTQTVSYCYDALHRVTMKDYSAHTYTPPACPITAPVVSYVYDSGTNAKGKLTSLTDQAGTASYTYDILGRLAAETRTLTGANSTSIPKNLSYEYNLDGSLYKLHYPSGNVVTYAPGVAGLTLSAIDSGNGINYVTGATYGPDSALTGFVSGNSGTFAGITNAFSYNKRLQPVNMSANAPSQTVFSIGYDFHIGNGTSGADNGNVFGITNYKDNTRNQTFTYDALNRLASARNAGTDCSVTVLGGLKKFWGNTYTYDAWGNLIGKSLLQTPAPPACAGENLSVTADVHNWIHATGGSDYLYDAAGNMTFNATPPTQNYTYDQENRLTGAAGYAYTYDADGNRVRKSNSSTGTLYWYMTPGIVGESDLSGNLTDEYVFFDGERVARKSTNGVFYYFSDHLKTASVITDASGNIKSESDFYPWGGELQFVNNDINHYKFTGKERDSETQLDYFGARYYSNGLGRWVSADWSPTPVPVPYADFNDPQSLNLYGFVGGNPASKADPDGHFPLLALAGGSALAEFGGPVLLTNPVGWTVLGVAAVATIGYVAYEHFHTPPSTSTSTNTGTPATTPTNTQTGTPASTSQAGVVDGSPAQATKAAPGTRPGQPFTKAGKREIDSANATANKGQTKCVGCNNDVNSKANKKGQPTPADQLQRHHKTPKSKGGSGTPENGEIRCPACHKDVHKTGS